MSFASFCVFTYTHPVSFLSKCHRKEPQRSSCAFYRAAAKKILRFPGLKLKRPAISRKKNFFFQTQKEVLACALFLGCTVSYDMYFCILVVTASWITNFCALLSWLLQIACLVQISGGCKRSSRELGALLGELAHWARYSVMRTTNNSTHQIYFK